MRYRLSRVAPILVLLIVLTGCGGNGDANNDQDDALEVDNSGISVSDAWVRPAILPEGSPTPDGDHEHDEDHRTGVISALYMVVENSGGQPVQLTAVESGVARVAEIHETQDQNGLLRMRPLESVEIPAGSSVAFEPGALHVMLVDINQPLEPGDEVAVTLVFSTGERLELDAVPVQDS